jgi:hypothetical protein
MLSATFEINSAFRRKPASELNMQLLNEGRMNMNSTRKRLSIIAFTVLLILFTSVSLYSQIPAGERLVFYLSSDGHVHTLFAPSGSGWTDVDLNIKDSFIPLPTAGTELTSFLDYFHYVHVFYLENTSQICELVITGISSSGFTGGEFVPTSIPGAPLAAAGSALTGFVDPTSGSSNIMHVFYQGANGHVYEFYHSGPGYPPPTVTFADPTHLAGAPVAASGSALTSFIDSTVMHVFYLGTDNHVHELYWTGGTAWHKDDPTSLAGAPAATSGSALTSFVDGSGVMHVFYLSSQNVRELYWSGSWHTDNATSQAGAPLDAVGSALTSFANSSGLGDTGMHVMYLGTNEHVYALHSMSSPAWSYFDATAAAGGVPGTSSGSKLLSFRDTATGGVRAYFEGQDAHVYELYWPTEGTASETDLTLASGAGINATGGPPSSLAGVME